MTHWSLRTRFLLFALAALIPFAAVLGYMVDRDLDRRIQQSYGSEGAVASSVSRSLASFMSTNTDALEAIAQVSDVISLDGPSAQEVLGQARNVRPELSGIFLVNADDRQVVARSGAEPELVLEDISAELDQSISGNTVTVSRPIRIDAETQVIVLLVPVTTVQTTETSTGDTSGGDTGDDVVNADPTPAASQNGQQATQPPGQTIGVVGGIIQLERLGQALLPSNRAGFEIALVSTSELILSTGGIDPASSVLPEGYLEPVQLAIDGESTAFEMIDSRGVGRTAVSAPVPFEFAPWAVIASQRAPGVLDTIPGVELAVVLLLGVLVIVAVAVVFSELTARPIRTLARQTQELHQGTLKEPIVPLGGGEVRVLSQRLAEMAEQVQSQVAGLEEGRHDRERQAAQMRDLLRRTNRMQEDERRRIAGEIHDAVSPLITGALYQTRALQMTNGSTTPDEMEASLRSVNELLEAATDELHGVIFELRPPDLDDIGLVAAIDAYVQTIQRTGLSCRLEVSGEPPSLTPEVRLSLYRIVQEALHNVVRHAGADEAVVQLETTDELIRLTVRDNGAGFDPAQAVQPTSLGLLSMRERAESIGATFTIVSKPGGGTAIVIERQNSGDVMSDEVLESMMSRTVNGSSEEDTDGTVEEAASADAEASEPVR